MTSQESSQSSVDLSTLPSYSSGWSHPLRLTTCLAVQYSARRLTERLKALENGANTPSAGLSLQDDDASLGVSLGNDVKELDLADDGRDDEGTAAKAGSWAAERKRHNKKVLREDWEDYCGRVSDKVGRLGSAVPIYVY